MLFLVLRQHLQAAELAAACGGRHDPPGRRGAQARHQVALHRRAIQTGVAELGVVDADGDDVAGAGTSAGAGLVVPAGGEEGGDVVDAVQERRCRQARLCRPRSGGRGRRRGLGR